jgi:adenine phosphoribosyltransferase
LRIELIQGNENHNKFFAKKLKNIFFCEKLMHFFFKTMQDEKTVDAIASLMPKMKKHDVEFISMTPLLASPKDFKKACNILIEQAIKLKPTVIAGIDSRGYIIGSILAHSLGVKFVMIAKSGKLPGDVIRSESYQTEYNSQDSLEMSCGVIDETDKVLVCDDILATGGSALNASNLIMIAHAQLVGFLFLGEILAVLGKVCILKKFPDAHVFSVCQFKSENTNMSANPPLILQRDTNGNFDLPDGLPLNCFPQEVKLQQDIVIDIPDTEIHNLKIDQETNRIVLMYHPTRKQHAEEIFLRFPNHFQLQEISWGVFPDGWSNIKLLNTLGLVNRHVVFLFAMDDISVVLEQLFVCMILPAQFLKSLIIDINYFAPGTHERVTSPGVLASAEPMARMFSVIPHTKSGPVIIQLTDLHALPNQFYFQKCFTSFISSIPMLLECKPQSTIVFPDDGGYKRFSPMILAKNPNWPMLICSKMRDGENRSVTISEYKNFPRHYLQCVDLLREVIIVDDLIHSGGTIVECAKALKKIEMIQFIDVWVTHGVFENRNYEAFLKTGKHANLFRDIHITNSILSTSRKVDFKIHSMAKTMGENLLHLIQPKQPPQFPVLCVCPKIVKKAIDHIFKDALYWAVHFVEDVVLKDDQCREFLYGSRLEIIIASENVGWSIGWSITIRWFLNAQEFKSRHEAIPDELDIKKKVIEMVFH